MAARDDRTTIHVRVRLFINRVGEDVEIVGYKASADFSPSQVAVAETRFLPAIPLDAITYIPMYERVVLEKKGKGPVGTLSMGVLRLEEVFSP